MNQHFALLGHPISHSISPFIHRRLFEIAKIPAEYVLLDVCKPDFLSVIPTLSKLNGYNITIPYKQAIITFVGQLCGQAKIYSCINTVNNSGGASFGYNTDAPGFLQALRFENLPLAGNVTILGCGGVARIFCFEAVFSGCNVTLAVRAQSLDRAKALANEVERVTGSSVAITLIDEFSENTDILINATPVGMFPHVDESPIADAALAHCRAVFDAVYNPHETLLIKKAKSNGLPAVSGLSMLIFQAVFAHKIWNDVDFSDGDIAQLIADSSEFLKRFG